MGPIRMFGLPHKSADPKVNRSVSNPDTKDNDNERKDHVTYRV